MKIAHEQPFYWFQILVFGISKESRTSISFLVFLENWIYIKSTTKKKKAENLRITALKTLILIYFIIQQKPVKQGKELLFPLTDLI